MGRVFIVQDLGDKDLTQAAQFGAPVALLAHDFPVFGDGAAVIRTIRVKLRDFDPIEDHVLPIGDPVLIGAVFAVLGKSHTHVKVLKWDKRHRHYWPIDLNI